MRRPSFFEKTGVKREDRHGKYLLQSYQGGNREGRKLIKFINVMEVFVAI